MDADRNLLFGVLALHADLITTDQFAEAYAAWAAALCGVRIAGAESFFPSRRGARP